MGYHVIMTSDPIEIGIADAKRRFADVLGAVRHRGERFVIQRRGTPVAALVPIADLDRLRGRSGRGFLALVGAFDDAGELPETLDQVVRNRRSQRTRPPVRLTE
jgi:prevent-host-death family protein